MGLCASQKVHSADGNDDGLQGTSTTPSHPATVKEKVQEIAMPPVTKSAVPVIGLCASQKVHSADGNDDGLQGTSITPSHPAMMKEKVQEIAMPPVTKSAVPVMGLCASQKVHSADGNDDGLQGTLSMTSNPAMVEEKAQEIAMPPVTKSAVPIESKPKEEKSIGNPYLIDTKSELSSADEVCETPVASKFDDPPSEKHTHGALHPSMPAEIDPQQRLKNAFDRFDDKHAGFVSLYALRDLLALTGLVGSNSAIRCIVNEWRPGDLKKVSFEEFLELRHFCWSEFGLKSTLGLKTVYELQPTIAEIQLLREDAERTRVSVMHVLSQMVKSVGAGTESNGNNTSSRKTHIEVFMPANDVTVKYTEKELTIQRDLFNRYDVDDSGEIDLFEFRDLVQDWGWDASNSKLTALMQEMGAVDTSVISFQQFLHLKNYVYRHYVLRAPDSGSAPLGRMASFKNVPSTGKAMAPKVQLSGRVPLASLEEFSCVDREDDKDETEAPVSSTTITPPLSEGLAPLLEGPESNEAARMSEGPEPLSEGLSLKTRPMRKMGGRLVQRQDTGFNMSVATANKIDAGPEEVTDADRQREKRAWDKLVAEHFTAVEVESNHPHGEIDILEKIVLQGATVVHVAFAIDSQLRPGSSLQLISTHKRTGSTDKKEKKRKTPKVIWETNTSDCSATIWPNIHTPLIVSCSRFTLKVTYPDATTLLCAPEWGYKLIVWQTILDDISESSSDDD